jgi:quercetin 2,3-dioxygenase
VRLAGKGGPEGAIDVNQDLSLWVTRLGTGDVRRHELAPGRHAWLHVARGSIALDGETLGEGDGVAVSGEPIVQLTGRSDGEVLLFDLS